MFNLPVCICCLPLCMCCLCWCVVVYLDFLCDATGSSLNTVECYDPVTGKWSVAESMSTMRSRVGTAVMDGKTMNS